MEAEDIGVVGVRRVHALALTGLVHRAQLVAQPGGEFELHVLRGQRHALHQPRFQLLRLAA